MKRLEIALLLSFFCVATATLGQERTIVGKVTAFNQYPISNIEVRAKKSKAKTVTDGQGRFTLAVHEKDWLIIRDPVFHPLEKRVSPDIGELSINLIYDDSGKNGKKAIAKGYMTEKQIDHGVRYLNRDNNLYATFTDVFEAIEHAIPEAAVVNNADGSRGFILRGITSIAGNNNALFIVNGSIVDDITFVAPANIKEINKLTNAQASMFGSRGSNGVISIELYQ